MSGITFGSSRPRVTLTSAIGATLASGQTPGPVGAQGPSGNLSEDNVRRVTGSGSVDLQPVDRFALVDGPAQVRLPLISAGVAQVSVKDAGSVSMAGSLLVTTQDGTPVDGQQSITFVNVGQAATFTFIEGTGWIIT